MSLSIFQCVSVPLRGSGLVNRQQLFTGLVWAVSVPLRGSGLVNLLWARLYFGEEEDDVSVPLRGSGLVNSDFHFRAKNHKMFPSPCGVVV